MNRILGFLIIGMFSLFIIVSLKQYYPDALKSDQSKISVISAIIILSMLGSNIMVRGANLSSKFKQIIGWIVIIFMVISGYSYQLELKEFGNRIAANIIPGYAQGNGDGSVSFYTSQNGHFEIAALVNNKARIKFLFDTGASNVALTRKDAAALGIDTNSLDYNIPVSTANGVNWVARIVIDKIKIGPIEITDVAGSVSQDGLDISLLGMSFLRKLESYNIEGNKLTFKN